MIFGKKQQETRERTMIEARAKINLTLDVMGKREDGYHLVEMVMQSVDLHDDVRVTVVAEPMLSKLSRRRGLQLEALGSVLICTVMLADRFLFTIQDGFVLTTAIISAVLLTIGIRVVKRHDEENQN